MRDPADGPARVVRVVLAYEGTAYGGWQVQPDRPTIQGRLLDAARALLGADTRVTGASRTDAGVHALAQTVSIRTTGTLPVTALAGALNAHLPPDIRVLAAGEAPPGFDARRRARGQRDAYLVDTAPVASPLLRRFAWHVPVPLDVPAMRRALGLLRGSHDFSAYCAAPGRGAPPCCTVRSIHLVERRRWLVLLISADRFLHHMVRTVVGSAVLVGRGSRPPGWMAEALASRDRTRAGPTAPAHGLTLLRVLYPQDRIGAAPT